MEVGLPHRILRSQNLTFEAMPGRYNKRQEPFEELNVNFMLSFRLRSLGFLKTAKRPDITVYVTFSRRY